MIERKLLECQPDDPDRCQGTGQGGEGQCRYFSVKGLQREGLWDPDVDVSSIHVCPKHGGTRMTNQQERERVHDYRLQVWQQRLDEFAESEKVKSLRGEIGVLRLLAESILDQCKTKQDLLMYSSKISDLMVKTEKLVRTCDRVDSSVGMLLDRSTALAMGARIVEVIGKHVKEPAIIDAISNDIITILGEVNNENDD